MRYTVDRIENNIIILENIEDGNVKEIFLSELDFEVTENDVLLFNEGKYIKDELTKEERIKRIREKMNKLKEQKK